MLFSKHSGRVAREFKTPDARERVLKGKYDAPKWLPLIVQRDRVSPKLAVDVVVLTCLRGGRFRA
jgi:hypothetical protein